MDNYKLTKEDVLAKGFCEARGIFCDYYVCNDPSKIRVWVDMPNGTDFLRKKEYDFNQANYAVHESYRAISAKIFQNEHR